MRIAAALVAFAAALLGGALAIGVASGPTRDVPLPPLAVEPDPAAPGEARHAPRRVAAPACREGDVVSMRDDVTAHGGEARRALNVFTAPGGAVLHRFERLNANGVPTVFGILGARLDGSCAPAWYRVQLPLRPNGRTGWLRASDVRVTTVDTRIVVDLADRRVTLFKAGERVLQATAAIGKAGTPTPIGSYYVNQRLLASDPGGPFGPGAIGISAFSPTLKDWVQGGPIAIHGTNVPHLLGEAVSFGCVRVRNGDLLRLIDLVPEGTPVVIR